MRLRVQLNELLFLFLQTVVDRDAINHLLINNTSYTSNNEAFILLKQLNMQLELRQLVTYQIT
jgi:hypothetical protein